MDTADLEALRILAKRKSTPDEHRFVDYAIANIRDELEIARAEVGRLSQKLRGMWCPRHHNYLQCECVDNLTDDERAAILRRFSVR